MCLRQRKHSIMMPFIAVHLHHRPLPSNIRILVDVLTAAGPAHQPQQQQVMQPPPSPRPAQRRYAQPLTPAAPYYPPTTPMQSAYGIIPRQYPSPAPTAPPAPPARGHIAAPTPYYPSPMPSPFTPRQYHIPPSAPAPASPAPPPIPPREPRQSGYHRQIQDPIRLLQLAQEPPAPASHPLYIDTSMHTHSRTARPPSPTLPQSSPHLPHRSEYTDQHFFNSNPISIPPYHYIKQQFHTVPLPLPRKRLYTPPSPETDQLLNFQALPTHSPSPCPPSPPPKKKRKTKQKKLRTTEPTTPAPTHTAPTAPTVATSATAHIALPITKSAGQKQKKKKKGKA
eukprot:Seg4359.1 transcript_id=Seg4359.1/GoldUCD/mRNA.D3Y31 product="hypothetical protein" protein_id=Seg4359.1/GoldUCD/D3Y31